jgi:hypothetical protein
VLIVNTETVPEPELETNIRFDVEGWFVIILPELMPPHPLSPDRITEQATNGRLTPKVKVKIRREEKAWTNM